MTEEHPVYSDNPVPREPGTIRNCPMGSACGMQWESLARVGEPSVRRCGYCQGRVRLCRTRDELAAAICANESVVIRLLTTELACPAGNSSVTPLQRDGQAVPSGSPGCGIHGEERPTDR